MLHDAGSHYGEAIIKNYSLRLTKELGKGFTITRLKYLRRFYNVFSKGPTLSDQLSYSHYCEIMWFDYPKIIYYMNLAIKRNLSVRELRDKIKSKEYERIPKDKLMVTYEPALTNMVPNPIIVNNPNNDKILVEAGLRDLIVEQIEDFMRELGPGDAFIGKEYYINVKGEEQHIDILLFNVIENAYVVVELKIGKLDKKDIGETEAYMTAVDNYLKQPFNNKTIGIIIVKKHDEYLIEYSSNEKLIARKYILRSKEDIIYE